MRKLGKSNYELFLIVMFVVGVIILIFGYFIYVVSHTAKTEYAVSKGSILFDSNDDYIELEDDGIITVNYDNNYYLTYTNSDDETYKYKLGTNSVVYLEDDYQMYIYGNAYEVNIDGEVEKITGQTEVIKAGGPYFYKLSDRKYLFIDKKLSTDDGSISTTDYLIIELDKQGNATFINFENNVKTIGSLIVKGTVYDFDIANEKLIMGDTEVDLKAVLGSTNDYVSADGEEEEEESESSSEAITNEDYYSEYLARLKERFNNLTSSVSGINDSVTAELSEDSAYLDLTRWTTLKSVTSTVTTLSVNYYVFDPNNEYSEVFITLSDGDTEQKIQLSKSAETYLITDLEADTEYTLTYYYRLADSVGDSSVDVVKDKITVKTKEPDIDVSVTKITSSKIYYKVVFNDGYIPSACTVSLISDNDTVNYKSLTESDVSNSTYEGSFSYSSMGHTMVIKVSELYFDDVAVSYSTYAKFVN